MKTNISLWIINVVIFLVIMITSDGWLRVWSAAWMGWSIAHLINTIKQIND